MLEKAVRPLALPPRWSARQPRRPYARLLVFPSLPESDNPQSFRLNYMFMRLLSNSVPAGVCSQCRFIFYLKSTYQKVQMSHPRSA